jgi:hypothetical protein
MRSITVNTLNQNDVKGGGGEASQGQPYPGQTIFEAPSGEANQTQEVVVNGNETVRF